MAKKKLILPEEKNMQKQIDQPADLIVTKITSVEEKEIADRKMIVGVFRRETNQKTPLKFSLRKYKGDSLRPYFFEHGKTYTVPMWVADWLNGDGNPEMGTPGCCHVQHVEQYADLTQSNTLSPPVKKKLFSFTPVAKW